MLSVPKWRRFPALCISAALAAGLLTAGPAAGQDQQDAKPVAVDESALRYFTAQGDIERIRAEIARLKSLYPGWEPSLDVHELLSQSDPKARYLWDLLSEGNFAGLREAIATEKESDPEWEPPEALIRVLETAEARQRMTNASVLGQWQTVLQISKAHPELFSCNEMSALWNIGEAHARTGDPQRAFQIHTYILTNCDDPGARVGSMHKAMQLLPPELVDDLFKLERKGLNGEGEFQVVRDNLIRASVGKAAQDKTAFVRPNDLSYLERLATQSQRAGDAITLGFYFYSRDQPTDAVRWFERALDLGGEAKAAEGLTLALTQAGDYRQAADLGRKWRDASGENKAAYLGAMIRLVTSEPPPELSAEDIEDFSTYMRLARSAQGAQALGFYFLNTKRTSEAGPVFRTALEWDPDLESAAFGLAITLQRLRQSDKLRELAAQWSTRSERISKLADEYDKAVARASAPVRSGGAARNCGSSSPAPQSLGPRDSVAFGWCLMNRNQPSQALAYFERARSSSATSAEAAYGQALAYMRTGQSDKAEAAAAAIPSSDRRAAELQSTLSTQRTVAAYQAGDYAQALRLLNASSPAIQSDPDMLVIKGWSHMRLGQMRSAEQAFRALLDTNRRKDGAQGLYTIEQRTNRVLLD